MRGTATYAQALQSVPETQVSQLDNGLRVASEQSSQPTCTVSGVGMLKNARNIIVAIGTGWEQGRSPELIS